MKEYIKPATIIAIIMIIPYVVFSCMLLGIKDFTVLLYVLAYKTAEYILILPAATFIYFWAFEDRIKYDICDIRYHEQESSMHMKFLNAYGLFPMFTTLAIVYITQRVEQIQSDNLYLIYIFPAMYVVRLIGQAICAIIIYKKL